MHKASWISDKVIVTYDLDPVAELFCHKFPACIVFFRETIFNGDDRVGRDPVLVYFDQVRG